MPSRYVQIKVVEPDGDLHVAFRTSGEFHQFEEPFSFDLVMVDPVATIRPRKQIESDRFPVAKALGKKITASGSAIPLFQIDHGIVDQENPRLVSKEVERFVEHEHPAESDQDQAQDPKSELLAFADRHEVLVLESAT